MIVHDLIQGSPEWHALRNRIKHTASDLAAIRGNSKYKTRAQAIREAATGIKPEVSAFQQKKFDEGHETEAKARVIVEQMIGEDLYPSTATTDDEFLLASTDGSTMMGDTGFEHKLWNDDIAAQIRASIESNTCQLHPMYTDQMDQQIAVYGFERIIFFTSNLPDSCFNIIEVDGAVIYQPKYSVDELKELGHKFESFEYRGKPESIARIRADWAQFDEDVANYQPEVIEAKPILTANPIDHLPALVIEVTGRVTHSNLVEFKAAAVAVIGSIKQELVTDQDFVDAAAAVKYLKDVEENAKRAKQNALDQTTSIAELHRALDEVSKMAGDVRKSLDKKITEEKDRRKSEIVLTANQELVNHIMKMNARIGEAYMPRIDGGFADAVKGLKSLESMKDKVSAALANAKIEASSIADRIDANLKSLEANGENWRFLFPDIASVCLKANDDFAALLAARIAAHKEAEAKRMEAERERIRQEEIARINAEQASAAAKAQREAEELARQNTRATANNQTQFESAAQQASVTGIGVVQVAANEADGVITKHIPTDAVVSSINDCLPSIKLGDICARLGITVTADFLASLGIEPVKVEKAAKLYDANKFPTICRLIADHIMAQAFKKAA